jgi:hypothetical protein
MNERWCWPNYTPELPLIKEHGGSTIFFETLYIKLASSLIKNLSVLLGTLVRKRVRLKLAAPIKVWLHR